MIKLSPRLKRIYSYIKPGEALIDVGTDHGYIPVSAAKENLCENIIAADINEGPLESAKAAALDAGVLEKIAFCLTDGLCGIGPIENGTIIIAGMGGELIIKILKRAPWVKRKNLRLVLQPQSKFSDLFSYLAENGFYLEEVSLVKDDGRIYIVGAFGYSGIANRIDILKALQDRDDPLFFEYLNYLIKKYKKIMSDMSRSENTKLKSAEIADKLNMLENMLGDI